MLDEKLSVDDYKFMFESDSKTARWVEMRRRCRMTAAAVALVTVVLACATAADSPQQEISPMAEAEDRESTVSTESQVLELEVPAALGERVLLRFAGVRHSLRSFEVRVFLGRPDADASTPLADEPSYAGSFHMYGHGLPSESRTGLEAVIEGGAKVGGQQLQNFDTVVDVSKMRALLIGLGQVQATLVVVEPGRGPLPSETFRFESARLD